MNKSDISVDLRPLLRVLAKLGPIADREMAKALRAETDAIFRRSQMLTPVDTGALRASGKVEQTGSMAFEISYGGSAAPYALYVHEIMTNAHAAPTQAKFLEQPLTDAVAGFDQRVGRRLAAALKGARA